MHILERLWDGAVSLLLPARCVGCGTGGAYLCPACQAATPSLGRLPHEPGRFAFDGAVAAFNYTGAAREAVLRLKYRGLRAAAPVMAAALARAAAEASVRVDAIVPVPLHPKRHRSRGYTRPALGAGGRRAHHRGHPGCGGNRPEGGGRRARQRPRLRPRGVSASSRLTPLRAAP